MRIPVYPANVVAKSLIKILMWLLGIGVAGIIIIAVISVTFMDNTVIQDAHWDSDKGIFCFTVLNNYSSFVETPVFSSNECNPSVTAATPIDSVNSRDFFGIIQDISLYVLASFKELWVDATGKQCRPFLYLRDSGNNCVTKVCPLPLIEVKNFNVHGELQQKNSPFSFLTTAKSQLTAQCLLDPAKRLLPGALMVFYGFSCESQSEQQSCERQGLVHTDHRLNYIVQ
jgi:hypothetical protein